MLIDFSGIGIRLSLWAFKVEIPGKVGSIALIRSVGAAESLLGHFISRANKVSLARAQALVQSNRQLVGVVGQELSAQTIGHEQNLKSGLGQTFLRLSVNLWS